MPSFGSHITAGRSPADLFGPTGERREGSCSRGIGWAYRRDVLEKYGLFDACIVGGGDTATICAGFTRFADVTRFHRMNSRQESYYLSWAEPFYESVRGNVSALGGDVFHLWHGDMRDRKSLTRHQELGRFDFDPYGDIARDGQGCWRWSSDKPELHEHVRSYFESRNEDGRSLDEELAMEASAAPGAISSASRLAF